jgi:hypothetical protein
MDSENHDSSFSDWIRSPQTMIALSAVLLSVCGLFVSVYEASLMREQQRASVWPNVEIGPSINPGDLKIFVQNTGVGPARIVSASLTRQGEPEENWGELIRAFEREDGADPGWYQSLITGRVLPRSSSQELIFRIQSPSENPGSGLADRLSEAISEEEIDVRLCYCSVYDECWTTRMSDVMTRARGGRVPTREERRVERCPTMEASGI